jgi:hypothetical protein
VVVIQSGDLLHARLKAALAGADREFEFASRHQLACTIAVAPEGCATGG